MFRLTGPTVHLRDWTNDDLAPLADWMQPHHAWRKLDGPYYPAPSPEQIRKQEAAIRRRIAAGFSHPRVRLAIADAQTDVMLGSVSRYWQSEETQWLSLGVSIYDPAHWRRGIGFEALGMWCEYLLSQPLGLARLDLRTWSGNAGMIALAGKLGFKQEAVFRNARVVDGRFYDGLGFGILREEWEQRYPAGFRDALPGR